MPGKTVEACDRHIEAPSRQAAETIPHITSYATKRHLSQPTPDDEAYDVALSEGLDRHQV